jgi:hypothetical protein
VVGKVTPEMAKPLPARVAELIVRAAVPDEVRVSVVVEVVLTVTFPKLMEPALSVRLGLASAVPVPVKETMDVLPEDALLETVMVPVEDPVLAGPKLTWRVRD